MPEALVLLVIILMGVAGYHGVHAMRNRHRMQRVFQTNPPVRPRYSARAKQAARNMQVALLHLRQTPDFRRAAGHASHANEQQVPLWFRQRQFRRFRPQLIQHFAALVSQGATADQLMPGLQQLVTSLGFDAYEADYIRSEAVSNGQQPTTPGYAEQLRQAQQDHQQRIDTLERMSDLDPEMKEQLIEQERGRLQEQLRTITESEGNRRAS